MLAANMAHAIGRRVSRKIEVWRTVRRLSQTDLAKCLGLKQPQVSRILADASKARIEQLQSFAECLKVPLTELLDEKPELTQKQIEAAQDAERLAALPDDQAAVVRQTIEVFERLRLGASDEGSPESPPGNPPATPKTNPGPRKQARRARSA